MLRPSTFTPSSHWTLPVRASLQPLLPSDLSAQARPCGHRRSPEVIRDLTRGADAMTGRWSKPRRPPSAQSCSLVSTRYAVLIALAQCRPASVMGNSHCGNILDSAWATIHDGSGDICSAHPFLFSVSLSQVRGWWLQLRMACRRLSAPRRRAGCSRWPTRATRSRRSSYGSNRACAPIWRS